MRDAYNCNTATLHTTVGDKATTTALCARIPVTVPLKMSLLVLRRSRHIMPSLLAHRHLPQRHLSSSNSPPSVSSELAHLATSKKITALGENLTSILEFTERNHATFNDYNWARLLNQLKRLSPKKRDLLKLDARFPLLLTNLSQALPTCSSTSTGSIVHSLTMLQLIATQGPSALRATIPPAVFSRITADADSYVTTATPSHIASLALAYATLHVPSTVTEPYFAAINAHAQALVDRSSTPPIVGLTTAFALTKIRGDGLFEHIRRRAGYLASTGTIPELAALLKAFAMQSFYAPALFRAASEKSSLLSSTGTASELADCIRSYGMMRFDSPKMLKAVSGKSLFILETGSSSDVSAVCVAFAHLNKVPSLFRVLEKNPHLLDRFIDGAQAPHLCSFVWSLSTLGLCSEKSQLLERAWDHTLTLPVHHFTKFELNQLAMVREFAWSEGVELREMGGNMKRQVKAAEVDGTQIYASEYEDLCR